jgi:DNA-binding transcriptional ArsR family regulator
MSGGDRKAQSELFFALAEPLRQEILKEMAGVARLSPQECAARLGVPLSKLSYHVRVLAKCGAVVLAGTEPVRGSLKHYYRFAIEEPWALAALGLAAPEPPAT